MIIRVRHIINAVKHGYMAQTFVVDTETKKVTAHTPKKISIDATNVRLKNGNSYRWESERPGCGSTLFLLKDEDVQDETLRGVIETNGGLKG